MVEEKWKRRRKSRAPTFAEESRWGCVSFSSVKAPFVNPSSCICSITT